MLNQYAISVDVGGILEGAGPVLFAQSETSLHPVLASVIVTVQGQEITA